MYHVFIDKLNALPVISKNQIISVFSGWIYACGALIVAVSQRCYSRILFRHSSLCGKHPPLILSKLNSGQGQLVR
jgi:hypothetical protein